MCLDLDHFKTVNDTLGHPIGDELLSAVAERLQRVVRGTDTMARLGGDEFAVVQTGARPTDASELAAAHRRGDLRPYDIDGHQVIIGTSIGIAIAPNDGNDPDQLLRNADMALYRAKADGRGTYRFFEPEMDAQMQARRALELDLRKALAAGEFELYYQPLIRSSDRQGLRLRGAGALEPSRARHGLARRVHPARRGNRPDRAARRVGAAQGLHATPRPGRASSRSRSICRPCSSAIRMLAQSVVTALGAVGPAGVAARARDHRVRAVAGRPRRARHAASAPRARRAHLRWTISAPAIRR